MKKTFNLEGKQVTAVSNALIARLYRFNFGRDIFMDLSRFQKSYTENPESIDWGPMEDLTWLMLKEGGTDVGESPEEWLRTIDSPVSVYALSSEILNLWKESQRTTARPKKK